jgi:hypothetical protein
MSSTADTPYLITMATHPDHNAASRFKDACAQLDVPDLVAGYEELVATAPHRHDADRLYFVGHDGRPSSGSHTNRIEEHLAIALVNDHPQWEILAAASIDLLDYQVPLKAYRSDVGVGKIDLFGLSENGVPAVIELKVLGKNRADTPLRALLEALSYAAIVEANASAIGSEITANTRRTTASERPDLLVVAPADYWGYWGSKATADAWIESFGGLADGLARRLGVDIGLLSIGNPELKLGLDGARPHINAGFETENVAWWFGRPLSTTSDRSIDR